MDCYSIAPKAVSTPLKTLRLNTFFATVLHSLFQIAMPYVQILFTRHHRNTAV